ncbi:MAG: hypothetical protein LBC72_05670 [Spirochaetaceae bacterium]|jgi:hypothetical protein|nr:hypothetical protein [Spirochaetaceae bacterium]
MEECIFFEYICRTARRQVRHLAMFAAAAVLFSCGMEDYPYLPQVPPSNVTRTSPSTAAVNLPPVSEANFLHFSFYYRIYVSDVQLTSSIGESEMSGVNSSLYSDFSYIKPYTQADNNLAANTGSIFSGRNFFEVEADGVDMAVLLNDSGGFTVNFDFSDTSPGRAPFIQKSGGGEYPLRRSSGSGLYNPLPNYPEGGFDGRFVNTAGLNAAANATTTVNRDVANKSSIAASSPRYTYASLYVCTVGVNNTSLTPIFSAPTFVGAFLLPRQWWSGEN